MIQALLTIDDVPSKNTPAIVDYLNEKGIQAVLFVEGQRIAKLPQQAIYALQHGMILGNHSYSHPSFSKLSLKECLHEIESCEKSLDDLHQTAGIEREHKVFRFPYGDKGGENKARLQEYFARNGFQKVKDSQISFPWWTENGLNREIDTLWTFDFMEYRIRPNSGFALEDVWNRIHDKNPASGGSLLSENSHHILLLHAHDETEEMIPGYYRLFIDHLLDCGVVFEKPEFIVPDKQQK